MIMDHYQHSKMEEYFSIIEFSARKEVIKVDRDLYDETLDVIDLVLSQ